MGHRGRTQGGDVKGTLPVTVAFIAAKSLFASRPFKEAVERRLGPRVRNGLYRPLYIVFSSVGGALIVRKAYQGPHRVLYELRGPFKGVMRAGQVACVLASLEATRVVGPGFLGVPQLRAFVSGGQPDAEPEAQGPRPDKGGELSDRTVFGLSRHPNNWFPTAVFLLEPRMTDKRAAFCALMSLHVLLGSVHEEYRLEKAYGSAYDRYKTKAPFLFRFGRKTPSSR